MCNEGERVFLKRDGEKKKATERIVHEGKKENHE